MKIVLDTNVLVSALLTRDGVCAAILGMVGEGFLHPCLDERILKEYERVLLRPYFQIDPDDRVEALEVIRANGESVVPMPLSACLPHPDDLPFLEVAASADAILVTGNVRHFPPRCRFSVTVALPQDFLNLLRRAE